MLGVEAARLLEWYMVAGVDFASTHEPINYFALKPEHLKPEPIKAESLKSAPPSLPQNVSYQAKQALPSGAEEAQEAAAKAATIAELQASIRNFELCPLKKTAANTLLGVGNIAAKILIIGDVPSAEDDANGRIFSDASGELLQKMLRAIELDLSEHCFLINISPWRTPANRLLNADEVALCAPFIRRHIELAQPNIIISLGATPANAMIGKNVGINNLRTAPNAYENTKIFTTYHPNVLLKNPAFKRNAWQDLLAIKPHLTF